MINQGISSSVEAMTTQSRRLDAITSNIANVSTPGYKRRTTAIHGFDVMTRGQHAPRMQPAISSTVDFSQGLLKQTGRDLDIALQGDGFLVVEGPNGELLSRGGTLRLDENGTLQDASGHAVAWEGPRARIEPNAEPVTIDESGLVFQGGTQLGQLSVVDIPARDRLQPRSGGYWYADPALQRESSDAQVIQGALEGANSSAVDELIELVRVQRQFESATRLMTTIDASYQRLNRGR